MFNPCIEHCYKRNGKQYNPDECNTTCEYAKAIEVLKKVLIVNEGCSCCKHSYYEKGVGVDCDKMDKECKNHSLYEIDFEKVNEEYE